MFRAEFAPEAIALAVDMASGFKSEGPYLRRLRADVTSELEQIMLASKSPDPFVRQFCPARAAECYAALDAIDKFQGVEQPAGAWTLA